VSLIKSASDSLTQPVSAKTIEALGDAVRAENYRIHAYEIQQRYVVSSYPVILGLGWTSRGEQPLTALANKPREYFEQNLEGIRWEDVAAKVSTAPLLRPQVADQGGW
jgi:hypothetical protein